ncbi:hypothetical protein [Aeromonas sp. 1HA1]|uniref:hypothetical protein n=1 Tax=Aeromonas sp. 1HA1 TaxID=2699193 RepID=UPI0023DE056D|nr:hypothetical protein [Aeromonas sp. 1HA1]MDF2413908.1 hypothetical protein [Aeromonas sp. 1HA1]
MPTNKIEIYRANGEFLKEYDNVFAHDLSRTLFNHVSELEGWSVKVDMVGINGVERGNEISRKNEKQRRIRQDNIEQIKIMNCFTEHDIGKITFKGMYGEPFSISYENESLILDRPLD